MSSSSEVPLEERLPALLGEGESAEVTTKLGDLGRDLDRLARRDAQTGEIYVHEPSLQALLNKHSPPGFGKRYLRLMKESQDGHLVRDAHAGRNDTPVSLEAAGRAAGTSRPDGTAEALGLTRRSSLQDLRRAIQPHVPDLPDFMYAPEVGQRLQQVINRPSAAAGEAEETAELAPDYWEAVKTCFGTRAGIWWELGVLMFLWAFAILWPTSGGNVAGAIVGALLAAGLFIAIWLLWSLVYCLIAALF